MIFLGVVGIASIAAVFAFFHMAVTGIRSGIVRGRGCPVSRQQHPILFWALVIVYVIAASVMLLAGAILLRAAWLGCASNATIRTCNVFSTLW